MSHFSTKSLKILHFEQKQSIKLLQVHSDKL